MDRYVTRPGVVLTSICGEHMLLAAKAAREHCPYMTQLNESSAFLWRKLEDGAAAEDLLRAVLEEYEIAEPEARKAIDSFLEQMLQHGYLLRKGEQKNE
ncbi:MAG: PqqD family protein [Oscillospiraceae bacterium]|nr:PqqD family protein [Clostridia bacterium]MBQ6272870.1 PqqD family protein [Oscillospiraceae bacterium]